MYSILSESLILKMIFKLYNIVKNNLNNSYYLHIVNKFVQLIRIYLRSSIIKRIFTVKSHISNSWEYGHVNKIVRFVLLLPEKTLTMLYKKTEHFICRSITHRIIVMAINNIHLLTAILLFISLVAPFRWNNLYAFFILAILTLLLYLKPAVIGKEGLNVTGISLYTVVFVIAIFAAQLISISPSESFKFLIFYVNCFMLVILLKSSIKTTVQLQSVIEVILTGITITGLLGIWMAIIGVPVDPSLTDTLTNPDMPGRVYATIKNTNDYAESLLILLPFYLAVVTYSKSKVKKLLFTVMATPAFIALVLTYSRTSWIGLIAAILIFVFFANKKLILPLVIVGLLSVPLLPSTIINRVGTITTGDTSIGYRFKIFKTVLPIIKDYWFSGIGLGTFVFKRVVTRYPLYTEGWVPPHSHNIILHIWIESGIIGLLSFIGWVVHLFKTGINRVRYETDTTLKYTIIASISSLSGAMIAGMGEHIWHEHRVMLLFWAVIGIITAAIIQNGDSNRISKE